MRAFPAGQESNRAFPAPQGCRVAGVALNSHVGLPVRGSTLPRFKDLTIPDTPLHWRPMIARVTLEIALRKEFDYAIPEELAAQIEIGSRVKVPFGPRQVLGS